MDPEKDEIDLKVIKICFFFLFICNSCVVYATDGAYTNRTINQGSTAIFDVCPTIDYSVSLNLLCILSHLLSLFWNFSVTQFLLFD